LLDKVRVRIPPRSRHLEPIAALAALALIVGLGLCLVHVDDHGSDDACLILTASSIAPALLAPFLPTGRLMLAAAPGAPSDRADPFVPPPEA